MLKENNQLFIYLFIYSKHTAFLRSYSSRPSLVIFSTLRFSFSHSFLYDKYSFHVLKKKINIVGKLFSNSFSHRLATPVLIFKSFNLSVIFFNLKSITHSNHCINRKTTIKKRNFKYELITITTSIKRTKSSPL